MKKVTFALMDSEQSPTIDVYIYAPEDKSKHAEQLVDTFLQAYHLSMRFQRTLEAQYHPADGARNWQVDLEGLLSPELLSTCWPAIEGVTPREDTPRHIADRMRFDYATPNSITFAYGDEGCFTIGYNGRLSPDESRGVRR
jgi:hypothetical protein